MDDNRDEPYALVVSEGYTLAASTKGASSFEDCLLVLTKHGVVVESQSPHEYPLRIAS